MKWKKVKSLKPKSLKPKPLEPETLGHKSTASDSHATRRAGIERFLTRVLVAVLLCVTGLSPSLAADRRTDKSQLTIMTFNGEFLWDGVAPEEGQANFPWKDSQTEAEEHMQRVAQIIIHSNPDIINLVEVENLNALNTLNTKFLAGRGYKAYLVQGTDTTTGQDVALLTRIDPDGALTRDDRKGQSGSFFKSVSKNYTARFTINNRKIALIGLHFLARPLDQSRKLQRQAQADAVRGMAIDLKAQGYSPVVLGDFNDYDGNADSLDRNNHQPVTNVLSSIRAMQPGTSNDDLINVLSFVPKLNRYTAFYDPNDDGEIDLSREVSAIDHILLAPELATRLDFVDIPHTHDPRRHPDHFSVVVRLKLADDVDPSLAPVLATVAQPALRIIALVPNPAGDENHNESVTLQNRGGAALNLQGWKLRDVAGATWSLDALGVLAPGQSATIRRQGQPMAMNNNGDTIDLLTPGGLVVQSVTYDRADEEETITPAS